LNGLTCCTSSAAIKHEKNLILAELGFGPQASSDLSMELFLGESTIKRRLKSLAEDGLVEYRRGMWWRIGGTK
jgi:DNA-binding MarR family transcriptional regulator